MTKQYHRPRYLPTALTWMDVTPQIAREWLKYNSINRKIRQAYVKYLAEQILQGRFIPCGDGIDFRNDGVLMNGQHRLLAIVMADMPAKLLIVPDLPPDVFMIRDRGNTKMATDVLKLSSILLADASLAYHVYMKGVGRVSEIDQRDIATWLSPAHEAMVRNTSLTHGFAGSGLRLGFIARWAIQTDQAGADYVRAQYHALQSGNLAAMSQATGALWKRAMQNKVGKSSALPDRVYAAGFAFYLSNPAKASVAPKISNTDDAINQLRGVLSIMEQAYIMAPVQAQHPYRFPTSLPSAEKTARAVHGAPVTPPPLAASSVEETAFLVNP